MREPAVCSHLQKFSSINSQRWKTYVLEIQVRLVNCPPPVVNGWISSSYTTGMMNVRFCGTIHILSRWQLGGPPPTHHTSTYSIQLIPSSTVHEHSVHQTICSSQIYSAPCQPVVSLSKLQQQNGFHHTSGGDVIRDPRSRELVWLATPRRLVVDIGTKWVITPINGRK